MNAATQIALSEQYISICSCKRAESVANEIVIACYDDFTNSVTTSQCCDTIEKKLKALIMSIENSFNVFDDCALECKIAFDGGAYATRDAFLDHLHYECGVIKFGINPLPGVYNLFKMWSMLANNSALNIQLITTITSLALVIR